MLHGHIFFVPGSYPMTNIKNERQIKNRRLSIIHYFIIPFFVRTEIYIIDVIGMTAGSFILPISCITVIIVQVLRSLNFQNSPFPPLPVSLKAGLNKPGLNVQKVVVIVQILKFIEMAFRDLYGL